MDGNNAARMAGDGSDDSSEDDNSRSDESSPLRHNGLQEIRENNPSMTSFRAYGNHPHTSNKAWARIGRDISTNTHLITLILNEGTFNDHKMSFLFRGLTGSSSIQDMNLFRNELSVAGVRSMVPFLQSANNLKYLDIDGNNIQSEGFNVLLRALSDSPIETLNCNNCGIESIEIDIEHTPRHLKSLELSENSINADGCGQLTKLLQGGDATLETLSLWENKIDDNGVEILVDALQSNTSLRSLDLSENHEISNRGQLLLLKLVNDISSITATLQSNHTLRNIYTDEMGADNMQRHIDNALEINIMHEGNPQTVGREKVIKFQLFSKNRADLAALQGIEHSVYSEIDPLHLPEVLSLLGRRRGRGRLSEFRGELYFALRSTVVGLFSMVNMKQCIQNETALRAVKIDEYKAMIFEHEARLKELNTRLETMDDSNQINAEDVEVRNNKRRRVV